MLRDFFEWWHKTYFRIDHPLYGIYKELQTAGADLDYIDGLTRILRVADQDIKFIEQDLNTHLPPKLRNIAHPSSIAKRVKEGIREFAKKQNVTLTKTEEEELRKYIGSEVNEYMDKHAKNEQESYRQAVEEVFKTNPLGSILHEYGCSPYLYKTGRKSDAIGDLFLLSVSEHLRETGRKPRFLLAINLLRAVRGQQQARNKASRVTATVRVNKFKKSSHDWKKHLRILREHYRSFKSGKPSPPFIASLETLEGFFSTEPRPPVTFER